MISLFGSHTPRARGPTCEGRCIFREYFSGSDTVFVITSSPLGRVDRPGQYDPLCLTFRESSGARRHTFRELSRSWLAPHGLNALLVGSSSESWAEQQMAPLRVQAQPAW